MICRENIIIKLKHIVENDYIGCGHNYVHLSDVANNEKYKQKWMCIQQAECKHVDQFWHESLVPSHHLDNLG